MNATNGRTASRTACEVLAWLGVVVLASCSDDGAAASANDAGARSGDAISGDIATAADAMSAEAETAAPGCPTPEGATGTIKFVCTGLPAGVMGQAWLSSPVEGIGLPLSGNDLTFPDQMVGTYWAMAHRVDGPDPLVRTRYRPRKEANTPLCLRRGETLTITVDYEPIATSGKLWLGQGASLLGFAPPALTASGTATVVAQTMGAGGFTFDADGNAWVLGQAAGDAKLARFSAASLGSSGAPVPDVVIDSPSFGTGAGMNTVAFDGAGRLWVTVGAANKVVMFTSQQIAASGKPTAAVERTGIEAPTGLAFAAGKLVVSSSGRHRLLVLSERRAAAGSGADVDLAIAVTPPAPAAAPLQSPGGIAFDDVSVWVDFGGTLVKFPYTELMGIGEKTLSPAVQIQIDASARPQSFAFDDGGGLWLALAAGKFGRLAPTQLNTAGSKTPELIVTAPSGGPVGSFALFPASQRSPLWHR